MSSTYESPEQRRLRLEQEAREREEERIRRYLAEQYRQEQRIRNHQRYHQWSHTECNEQCPYRQGL